MHSPALPKTMTLLLVLILCTLMPSDAVADDAFLVGPRWIDRAYLPYPLKDHMVAALPDSGQRAVFVVGGRRVPSGPMEQACVRYIPSSNRWLECRQMRYPRGVGQAVGLKRRVYVIGGCRDSVTGSNRVEAYDPGQNLWYTQSNLPKSLCEFAAVPWRDSLIFALGGSTVPFGPVRRQVLIFNPVRNIWDSATPLPFGLAGSGCGIADDSIYVFCGRTEFGFSNVALKGIINPADPRQITWHELDTLPAARRSGPVAAVIDGRVFLVGGILPDGTVASDAWLFNPQSGTWSRGPDKPGPVSSVSAAAALGNRIYLPGGLTGVDPPVRTHHALDLGDRQRDIGADSVLSPSGRLEIGAIYPVKGYISNQGSSQDTALIAVRIVDTVSGQLAFQADITLPLDSAEASIVDFGNFIPSYQTYWLVSLSARSPEDQNPDNDTAWQRCRTNSASQPDAFGYVYKSTQEPDSITFNWYDTTGGTTLTNWSPNPDDGVSTRTLPFPFFYYGSSITQVNVSTDGFIQTTALPCPRNQPLPFPLLGNVIAPFWDDLTLREGGRVVENRTPDAVVYTWCDIPRYNAPTESFTFQVVLRSSGNIEFNYLRLTGNRTSSTIGIQGRDGSWGRYLEYLYDASPAEHVPDDSVSIIFYRAFSALADTPPGSFTPRFCLSTPSICAGGTLAISLIGAEDVSAIHVFDITGRRVITLPLPHSRAWDFRDDAGRRLTAGTYFITARTGSQTAVSRFVLLR